MPVRTTVKHVKCEGSVTPKTAYYTPEFGRRVCQALLQGTRHVNVLMVMPMKLPCSVGTVRLANNK